MPTASNLASLLWEVALETARQSVRPEAVSRLNCIFATETVEMARMFRDRFRLGSAIYEIEPWPDAKLFRGNFGLITADGLAGPYLDFMPPIAVRYWQGEPGEEVEVLIGGAAWVRGIVDAGAR